MGGIPGSSVVHYLVRMLHWILQKLDNSASEPAVLATLIDFSKGFNRMSPVILVTLLSDLNIPTCALRLIISYLSHRSMVTTYNGAVSGSQQLCGGGPQGSLLIVILFCLQVNLAGNPCPRLDASPSLPEGVHGPVYEPVYSDPPEPCHHVENTEKKIYVDDLSELEVIALKKALEKINPDFIGPMNYHEQSKLILPPEKSILQHKLKDIQEFTERNLMKVNKKKTMVMPFNFTTKYDFLPQLNFPGEEPLTVIYETKLLGVTISSDLTFSAHVKAITGKATKSMWLLLRFRDMGASIQRLLTLWQQKGRSTLEFASPVFFSRLTKEQSKAIEDCQRKAFSIMLGPNFMSYERALVTLEQERLSDRRLAAALKFGEKCTKNPKHSDMFPPNPPGRDLRTQRVSYKEYFCRTDRLYNSSIPTITRLLNAKFKEKN